jgi:putative ABC transport system substrate-binding protein
MRVCSPRRSASEAQSAGKPWRVGFVGAETLSTNRHWLEAFRLGMREQGYVEGQTLSIEDRWAEGRNERFRELGKALREWVRRLIVLSRRSA